MNLGNFSTKTFLLMGPFLMPLFLLISGCRGIRNTDNSQKPLVTITTSDTVGIYIKALDLSEDMSRVSTEDDEILLLLYELTTADQPGPLLLSKKMAFDAINTSNELFFTPTMTLSDTRLLLMLIEQDDETEVSVLDPLIKANYRQLIDGFRAMDYIKLEKIIGDDDLLGYKIISEFTMSNQVVTMRGVYKLDKYHYILTISKYD